MNYFTEYWYVWIAFVIMCIFLFSFYGKKYKQVKERRKQYEEKLAQERDEFSHLTSEVFDKIEPIDLTRAVIFHINAKEDRLFKDDNYDGNIIPYLTHEELLIYTMYQLECSLEGGRGSIHSFFITEPYCNYRPNYKEAFETMKCYDIAHLLEEAEKLANTPEAKKNKADGEAFLAKKAKEAGVQKTASGLLYKVIKEGKGEKPVENDKVTVSYKGTLIDGTQFDASEKVPMSVGQLVPGFNEALMLMTPGSKYEVYIPAELAYGTNPNPRIPVNSTLIFEIELLSVDK